MTEAAQVLPKMGFNPTALLSLIKEIIPLQPTKNDKWRGKCPFHESHAKSFYVMPEQNVFYCFGCCIYGHLNQLPSLIRGEASPHDCERLGKRYDADMIRAIIDHPSAFTKESLYREHKLCASRHFWNESLPACESPLPIYGEANGLFWPDDIPGNIRFHQAMLHEPSGRYLPAMIVAIHNHFGAFMGIHRTFLSPDYKSAADVEQNKRFLGSCYGYYAQFNVKDRTRVMVTPDIETAMILRQLYPNTTIWCSMTLGNLKAPLCAEVKEVTIVIEAMRHDKGILHGAVLDAARLHSQNDRIVNSVHMPSRILKPKE